MTPVDTRPCRKDRLSFEPEGAWNRLSSRPSRGVLTLLGVLASNSRSRAVMETKIDELTRRVETHSRMVERTFRLEQDMAVAKRDIKALSERTVSR